MVTSAGSAAGPLTPTGASGDTPARPGSSSSVQQQISDQQQNNTYVNFPSPSVIVSIATAVRSGTGQSDLIDNSVVQAPPVATRYLTSNDRDELIRNASVLLGSGTSSPSALLSLLARNLVELGARHGNGVLEDISAIFTSPGFEGTPASYLLATAQDYRQHFIDEARQAGQTAGIALSITVQRPSSQTGLVNVTLGLNYCVFSEGGGPFLRQGVALRRAQLSKDVETNARIDQLVQRTLKTERLDHIRKAIVCNSDEVIRQVLTGQMAVACAVTTVGRVLSAARLACTANRTDWKMFDETLQRIANTEQSNGWQMAKNIKPVAEGEDTDVAGLDGTGLDWMELVVNTWSQIGEMYKLWQEQRLEASVWNQLDRHLLGNAAAFFIAVHAVTAKLNAIEVPTLCNVLLARSHLVSLCTPKGHSDPPSLSALKHAVLEAVNRHWPLDMVHRLGCVLHPAFKHMRRLDVSDRERAETYAMVRNLVRNHPEVVSNHILRNTLESSGGTGSVVMVNNNNNSNGSNKNDLKRKNAPTGRGSGGDSASKRQRTLSSTASVTTSGAMMDLGAFDFSDLADFSLEATQGSNGVAASLVVDRDELDLYLEEKVIQQDLSELANVLVYWKHRQNVFPSLAQLAFWLLSLPSSSVGLFQNEEENCSDRQLFKLVARTNSAQPLSTGANHLD